MLSLEGGRSWITPIRWLQIGSVVVPLALAAGAGVWLWRAEYRDAEELATRNALLAAQYSLRLITAEKQLLRHADGLAWAAAVSGDLDGLKTQFAALVGGDRHSRGLALIDGDGRLVVSDQVSGRDSDFSDRSYFTALRDNPWTIYVDRRVIQPDNLDSLVIAVPRLSPAFSGVLVMAIDVSALADFFATLATTPDSSASLLRRDGMLLVRSDASHPPIQIGPDQPFMQVVRGERGPIYEVTAQSDGVTRLYATVPVADLPLYASYGYPVAQIRAAWLRRMLLVAAILAAGAAAGLLGIAVVNRRVQVRLAAQALEQSRREAEHKETLYRELNHRVGNNLQLVESLLRLHGRGRGDEVGRILREVALRVSAIAEVHKELATQQRGHTLDLADLLRRLTANPALVPPESGATVTVTALPRIVPLEQAIAAALIAVEAVTNAIKHAFPAGRGGNIAIGLTEVDGTIELLIEDDGVGVDPVRSGAPFSGLMLMERLAQRLGGSMALEVRSGTAVSVRLPATWPPAEAEADKAAA